MLRACAGERWCVSVRGAGNSYITILRLCPRRLFASMHTHERTARCPDSVDATQRMLSPCLGVLLPAPLLLLIESIRRLIAAEPTLSGMLDWASRGSLLLWSPEVMDVMRRNGPGGACVVVVALQSAHTECSALFFTCHACAEFLAHRSGATGCVPIHQFLETMYIRYTHTSILPHHHQLQRVVASTDEHSRIFSNQSTTAWLQEEPTSETAASDPWQ